MPPASGDIARILERARRREARIAILTALCMGLAAALAAGLGGAVAMARGLPPVPVRQVTLALAAFTVVGATAFAWLRLLARASTPEATARFLGRSEPALRSDLLSAVELSRDYPGLAASGYSLSLVDAHVARTAERAAGIDLDRAIPAAPARRAALALGGAALLCVLGLLVGGAALRQAAARLAGLGPPPPPPRAEPVTGDVELTYLYPAHTGRPSRTLSGTGGEVSAPRGTEVRLAARADRAVEAAELVVEGVQYPSGATGARPPNPPDTRPRVTADYSGSGNSPDVTTSSVSATAPGPRVLALEVSGGRQLQGRFVVDEPGTYHFRFRRGKKLVAEGPPIPIAVEPDAYPEVRITAPGPEVEVDAKARVRVDWSASDDYGLSSLSLVVKAGSAPEERRPLRTFGRARRESGSFELATADWKLGEGEKLVYWLEVQDNDAVSGPKRGASATQVVRIYSEAEHRRRMMERAQALWERLVRLLADRLETLDGPRAVETVEKAQPLDARAHSLHEGLREAAIAIRRERGGPRAVADALSNAAAGIRAAEQPLTSLRIGATRLLATLRSADPLWKRLGELDAAMDRELEKDALYLEQLFDQERARDLLRLARDLQSRRRDLASLLEKYRQEPSEEARRQLMAEIGRMKARMQEIFQRMAELAKGISDEHLNAEALAEMARQQDALGGLDKVEEKLARGDIEGAMKELDALGSRMQEMLSRLERSAGEAGSPNPELAAEMKAFARDLAKVEREQEGLAGETGKVREEYRRRLGERLQKMAERAGQLEKLARQAREELQEARSGLSPRAEEDFGRSREGLQDLERALKSRDFDAALESVRRALPAMQRLALGLEDDAQLADRFGQVAGQRGPEELREAGQHTLRAMQPARKVKDELERLFPDPRTVLSQRDQKKLDDLSARQRELEREAGQLRRKLQDLAEKAPVFSPQSQGLLGEAQGHMAQAAGELGQRNPQRGHGQQRQALDALSRFRKGLEEMAKNGRGGGGDFPFPFAMGGSERQEGDEGELSRERVEIPGAEAYRVPEEFRRDILDAMKQGAPEPYKGELQRYYEELVR